MSNLELRYGQPTTNLIPFPARVVPAPTPTAPKKVHTPIYDSMIEQAQSLDLKSAYKSSFDYSIYKNLELRYADKPIRGGITVKTAFRLVNSHSTSGLTGRF